MICKNGGVVSGYVAKGNCACKCAFGYEGENCEIVIPCKASHPLAPRCHKYHGKIIGFIAYKDCSCLCNEGYYGKYCHEPKKCLNSTLEVTCLNGGKVTGTFGKCMCICPKGYHGRDCGRAERCRSGPRHRPCLHNGKPVGTYGNCSCDCTDIGYHGSHC